MAHWLASPEGSIRKDWIKRFDPRFWTVNFPRPMMAAVTTSGPAALRASCVFYRADDLAGLIWESADRHDHPLLAYATERDYRGVTLAFDWRSTGLMPLEAVNGPTLTIEGRDAAGQARAWYVRLWNYAAGTPEDARVTLDFDALDGGFLLPGEADRVWAGDIDRLFVSMVGPGYTGAATPLAAAAEAVVEIDDIVCDGPGSVIAIGDAFVPPHRLRMATGYDDSYDVTPARLLRNTLALGYRDWLNHYVGMSHFFRLAHDAPSGAFLAVAAGQPLNAPFLDWHRDLLARAAGLGFAVILSLSYELFDAHAPQGWKQRAHDGSPALTGYTPPSTLLSPASAPAMAYLRSVAGALAALGAEGGRAVHFQVGEPWWWVPADRKPCIHDAAAEALFTSETGLAPPARVTDVAAALSGAQLGYLDWAGGLLGRSTLALRDAVRAEAAGARTYLLFYMPQVLNAQAAVLSRLNLPAEWARPAFDVLQLEDYDFVIEDDLGAQARAIALVEAKLAYPRFEQQYFAGFVTNAADARVWANIGTAIDRAEARAVPEIFVWAYPQIVRDGFTYFETGVAMDSFHDVVFPLAVGLEASAAPAFFTQVITTASGHEQRNSQWASARLRFDAGVGVRGEADLAALIGFFRARRGQACAFRFGDPTDYSSAGMTGAPTPFDQALGVGDGVRTRFALVKRYDAASPERRVTRPRPGTARVGVAGIERLAEWSLEPAGVVAFETAPLAGQAVTAGFAFDVPVRFATDALEISLASFRAGEAPSVPLVEVREA